MISDSSKHNGLHQAYIALGSNLGRREKNITAALSSLESTREIETVRVSPLYETPAEGGPNDQPSFINGVVHLRTSLSADRLLAVCQQIEELMGRRRSVHWGPRTIDLDLLAFDNEIHSDPTLTLPHPMMHERHFVMKPLADIAPDWVHPVIGESAKSILEGLGRRDWMKDLDD